MSEEASIARCVALLEAQGADIAEIKADVKAQNGRVRKLEDTALKLKTLWTPAVVLLGFAADYIRHKLGWS